MTSPSPSTKLLYLFLFSVKILCRAESIDAGSCTAPVCLVNIRSSQSRLSTRQHQAASLSVSISLVSTASNWQALIAGIINILSLQLCMSTFRYKYMKIWVCVCLLSPPLSSPGSMDTTYLNIFSQIL